MNVLRCFSIRFFMPGSCDNVYSSSEFVPSKTEGVIHRSKISQPPKLTPSNARCFISLLYLQIRNTRGSDRRVFFIWRDKLMRAWPALGYIVYGGTSGA